MVGVEKAHFEPEPAAQAFYRGVLMALREQDVPFVVGGGFAFSHYTDVHRYKKDLDVFVRPDDIEWALAVLADAGYRSQLIAPHWLGKAFCDDSFVDLVFSSGNGVAIVDNEWIENAEGASVLDVPCLLSPVEEMIWSKAFVQERERFDGADITHLIRARGDRLDWERLFRRFDPHWHVLFSHLVSFRFVYPSHRGLIPRWVMRGLMGRMQHELESDVPEERVCRGTLLSCKQYLVDVERWGYLDGRLEEGVQMTAADIALLTNSVRAEEARAKGHLKDCGSR
jgi:hypothetical protein